MPKEEVDDDIGSDRGSLRPLDKRLIVAKFSIPLPPSSCVFEAVTSEHPDLTIHYMSAMITGKDEITSDAELIGDCVTETLIKEMQGHKGTMSVEVLSFRPGRASCRIVEPLCKSISILRDLKLLPRFPFPIVHAKCIVVITGSKSKIRTLLRRLEHDVPGTVILSIRHGEDGASGLLTPHQMEVLRRAVSWGYYDVPRRTSLTLLAEGLGLSKSALWETMATIERKLLTTIEGIPSNTPARA